MPVAPLGQLSLCNFHILTFPSSRISQTSYFFGNLAKFTQASKDGVWHEALRDYISRYGRAIDLVGFGKHIIAVASVESMRDLAGLVR